jgi:NTE family protein
MLQSAPSPARVPAPPRVALALGGGGARGLAHIAVLEALDDIGVKPVAIAGTSIGAIVGAAYAAGLPGKVIREHVLRVLKDRAAVFAKLFQSRVGRLSDVFSRSLGNPVLLDGERLLDRFWPAAVPDRFEALQIPLVVVAADYHGRSEALFRDGPLLPAVAASMAVPGLVRPVEIDGRVFIDGGAVNPLPFDRLGDVADLVIAVDVTGGSDFDARAVPEPFEAMLGASQLMQQAIVAGKLEARRPDILIKPAVDPFRALDFFKARAILAAAEPVKEEVRRRLLLRLPEATGRGAG